MTSVSRFFFCRSSVVVVAHQRPAGGALGGVWAEQLLQHVGEGGIIEAIKIATAGREGRIKLKLLVSRDLSSLV